MQLSGVHWHGAKSAVAQSASSSSQSSVRFFCGVESGVDVLEPAPTSVDDFKVFVKHVEAPSADEDFGESGRKLDFGGHHGEEELTLGVRPLGVGVEVLESEILLIADDSPSSSMVVTWNGRSILTRVASAYW